MASRSLGKANSVMSKIEAAGTKGLPSTIQMNVTNERSIDQAMAFVHQQHGRLDVLVNNAGVGSSDPDVKTRFQLCIGTNILGPAVVSAVSDQHCSRLKSHTLSA